MQLYNSFLDYFWYILFILKVTILACKLNCKRNCQNTWAPKFDAKQKLAIQLLLFVWMYTASSFENLHYKRTCRRQPNQHYLKHVFFLLFTCVGATSTKLSATELFSNRHLSKHFFYLHTYLVGGCSNISIKQSKPTNAI